MTLQRFFQFVSYAAVVAGFVSLWVSGTFGVLITGSVLVIVVGAWFLEGSAWQISEKLGTALIVLALPAFYVFWRFQLITLYGGETVVAGILARMILALSCIKLLQRKGDRDWIFLYLMSFFQVLLAAGLSISALYLASFVMYLLLMVCAIIAFELRRTAFGVAAKMGADDPHGRPREIGTRKTWRLRKLPVTAGLLIVFIAALALPLFFMLPRVGGAGFGGNQTGLSTTSGFSDTVRLGGIGRIQQSDQVVMRVSSEGQPVRPGDLYLRGIALDTFDNQAWSKAKAVAKESFVRGEREIVQVDYPAKRDDLVVQTIYLEPLDTPVLFALPRAVAIQGGFPAIYKDSYGSLTYSRSFERISYKVLSDRTQPAPERLARDDQPYTADVQSYRTLPARFDHRIAELAEQVTSSSSTRYDKARAVEAYLQSNYSYSLEQKAAGSEPLADFLFSKREGHCEYFATAMAIMLRTQGIATRVVNGFHGGEYNDAADVTVVRERNAHAWVEVFFPRENSWVAFDPTPAAGQPDGTGSFWGITGTVNKYIDALETFWIRYFVAFDDQEQRSLVRSMKNGFMDYQSTLAVHMAEIQTAIAGWWSELRGDKGLRASFLAIASSIAYTLGVVLVALGLFWCLRRLSRSGIFGRIAVRLRPARLVRTVEFYDRMQTILASKGFTRPVHQTPLEFAFTVGVPEAVSLTQKYQRVRFAGRPLSHDERTLVEAWLEILSAMPAGPR